MTRAYEAISLLKIGCVDDAGRAAYPNITVGTAVAGRAVYELQEDLHQLGFLLPKPDGAFGENTMRAVMALQRAAGLEVDGKVGADTKNALKQRLSAGRPNDLLFSFVKLVIETQGFTFDMRPRHLNLLGIRGYWHGQKVSNEFNRYNDTIYAAWLDADGAQRVEAFDASCDPGRLSPAFQNAKGIAHLVEGQWWFQRGLHAGSYRALRQARPVKVKRFQPDDMIERLRPVLDEGFFGINIHAGGSTLLVNNSSAGCQVVAGGLDGQGWKRFDTLVYVTSAQTQTLIPYTLVASEALPSWT